MKINVFKNKIQYFSYLNQLIEDLDGMGSTRINPYPIPNSYLTIKGERRVFKSGGLMLKDLNERYNTNFDWSRSQFRQGNYVIAYLDGVVKAPVEPVVETRAKEEPSVKEDKEPSVKASVALEKVVVDYEELKAIYDDSSKKKSKDKLEAMVKEKFGIDLNKRLNFEGMIAELKEKLA